MTDKKGSLVMSILMFFWMYETHDLFVMLPEPVFLFRKPNLSEKELNVG
ncbi:hypothetical protein PEC302107_05190 [Pectobacterium araliae]|nr:hypothetical protein PEC302107_05190 [Pectobacterium carotovorum subsp. carotovorum]